MAITLLIVLFFHWVGDFICQTRWMADNKSSSITALLAHIFNYTAILGVPTLLFNLSTQWLLVNALTHFLIDPITSRFSKRLYGQGNVHGMFCVIGFDQFLHISILLLTTMYL